MSKAGSRILQGAREALAFAKGEADPAEYVIHIPPQVDVRAIRQKTGLSQKAFAARYGFSFGRVRDWEQGRSNIDAPSRILLTIIEKEPEAVERALSAA
ncbi:MULTISPECIES: helix-turn-helix domain-containing protein [Hyphomicrobiales]|jgi:putative transcriptional regulator|uniref:Helix-turn-helix domain-containing protein n=2 Tax=Brucella TaxID=234 RepID=A0A7V6P8V9_9HYPH|nr:MULTISPECIES: helix-turn-helix domain-containing protein [Brucella/Ochrobactrum group]KAB2663315.1 helix-turn-helix domain-containing protein [Brucella tritici]MCR5943832.1 helix-turn-helix domain-containing protein [Ochrobactrum sp. XJ1]PJO45695.1 transcriptional regulator [Brucella pituitosa]HHV66544.1 helix-turn-helix domain-containing protein [Brucella intermedia]